MNTKETRIEIHNAMVDREDIHFLDSIIATYYRIKNLETVSQDQKSKCAYLKNAAVAKKNSLNYIMNSGNNIRDTFTYDSKLKRFRY